MLEKLLAKRHINNLDLRSVREKSIDELGWSSSKAEDIELDYRRFLYALAHTERDELISPPSQEVDEFWHQHILDTQKYLQDCKSVFGYYMHHTPSLTADEQAKADARRRKVYADNKINNVNFNSGDAGFSDFDGGDGGSEGSHHAHGSHDAAGGHHPATCD